MSLCLCLIFNAIVAAVALAELVEIDAHARDLKENAEIPLIARKVKTVKDFYRKSMATESHCFDLVAILSPPLPSHDQKGHT